MSIPFSFEVPGKPVPQGSTKTFPITEKGTRRFIKNVTTNKTPALTQYRADLRLAASSCGLPVIDAPVEVVLKFSVERPKTVKREYPAVAPDLDKYCRSVCDALEGICFKNDSQVVGIIATKRYADSPSTFIHVREAV